MEWCAERTRQELADGKFIGYEKSISKRLFTKLPSGHVEFEDILGWMRLFSLEAIKLFDPDRGAEFTTFLYTHLKLRAYQWKNWAWLKQSHPEGRFINLFSHLDKAEITFDPVSKSRDSQFSLQLQEFVESLSEESTKIFHVLSSQIDDSLLSAIAHRGIKAISCRLPGYTFLQITDFLDEVLDKAPRFLEVYDGLTCSAA